MRQWLLLVEAARLGKGGIVEVIGEPGVGKSRLIEEFVSVAGEMTMLSATCEDYESSTPYAALREVVARVAQTGRGR